MESSSGTDACNFGAADVDKWLSVPAALYKGVGSSQAEAVR